MKEVEIQHLQAGLMFQFLLLITVTNTEHFTQKPPFFFFPNKNKDKIQSFVFVCFLRSAK